MYNVHIRFLENWSTNSQEEEIWAKCLLNPGCIHLMLVVQLCCTSTITLWSTNCKRMLCEHQNAVNYFLADSWECLANPHFTKWFSLFTSLKNSQQKNVRIWYEESYSAPMGRKQNHYTVQQQNFPQSRIRWFFFV